MAHGSLAALFLLAAAALCQQTPAVEAPPKIDNTGAPMRVPFDCSDEDIRAFGMTCPARRPCPVYLELAALGSSGARIFLSGNLHPESVTLYSILLATDDSGKTWYETHPRLRTTGLDEIQFFDLETGWVGGQQLGAVPRDPFLLLTRDGGKSWSQRSVYEESRVGAIDHFRFDSKRHGLLWIDRTVGGDAAGRYELLESETGGESWMLRESSDHPIAGAERSAPSAGLRLRTNAATRSYRLERQDGEKWTPVASFLVRVGECRESEPTLAPEPPQPAGPPAPGITGAAH
jgi:hypothetical protein